MRFLATNSNAVSIVRSAPRSIHYRDHARLLLRTGTTPPPFLLTVFSANHGSAASLSDIFGRQPPNSILPAPLRVVGPADINIPVNVRRSRDPVIVLLSETPPEFRRDALNAGAPILIKLPTSGWSQETCASIAGFAAKGCTTPFKAKRPARRFKLVSISMPRSGRVKIEVVKTHEPRAIRRVGNPSTSKAASLSMCGCTSLTARSKPTSDLSGSTTPLRSKRPPAIWREESRVRESSDPKICDWNFPPLQFLDSFRDFYPG